MAAGQTPNRALISNVTNASPCVVVTTADHEYESNDFVRITDVNSSIPVLRGMDQINNKKFRVIKINDTSFFLQDSITFKGIDSTDFTPYVLGGRCNLVEAVFQYNGA